MKSKNKVPNREQLKKYNQGERLICNSEFNKYKIYEDNDLDYNKLCYSNLLNDHSIITLMGDVNE